jgi:hypothetical protein
VNRQVIGVAWFRFRATLGRRWGGYLSVVLLVGLLGGLGMGAAAGARRTQSSFPNYLTNTNSSDLDIGVYPEGNPLAAHSAFYRRVTNGITHLPDVQRLASNVALFALPLKRDGAPSLPQALNDSEVEAIGSVNGLYFGQDRVAVVQGHMADPRRINQFVATVQAARLLGWHLGEVVPIGIYSFQQFSEAAFGTPKVRPVFSVSARLTGLVVFQSEIVRDDVDQFPTFVLFTPALTERVADSGFFPTYAIRLKRPGDVAVVERQVVNLLPRGATYNFHLTSVVAGEVERAIKPEAIALGIFGAIAGVAALLLAGQAIGRGLLANSDDLDVMRALGADPKTTLAEGLIGTLGAVLAGSLVAVGVAIGLSRLSPIGPVRQVEASPGVAFDWAVLGVGFAVLVVCLAAVTMALAYRGSPHRRAARRRGRGPERISGIVALTARVGLPAPAVTGVRFALERGRGRTAVPVRSALLGAVLAIVVVVATLTFASGLNTLVSHPDLYGWNWSYAIDEVGGGQVPPPTATLLNHDAAVAAWTGFRFGDAQIDGQTVPLLISRADAPLTPPILSGHALDGNHQIVLGAATMAALHKRVGDTVTVSYGTPKDAPVYVPPTPAVIVGTATLPAIGNPGVLHPSMGTGAIVSYGVEPAAFRKAQTQPDPNLNGPAIVVVRLRPGVRQAAGLASLQRVARTTTELMAKDPMAGGTYRVLSVQRPAEIVNYRSTGATPAVLASGLAGGAVVGLGFTLVASVRRRRRDLALLKTLGFTGRQLAATLSWQASVAAVIGIVVGVPLGIALGRWLWILFAHQIFAVADPTVPALQVVLVAVGALVLANLVAAVPGRLAARTPTALLLRAE